MRSRYCCPLIACLTIAFLAVAVPCLAETTILVVHTYSEDWPMRNSIDQGLRRTFNTRKAGEVNVFFETLDVRRFPDPDYKDLMLDYLHRKYERIQPTVIIAVHDTSFDFLQSHRSELFPSAPIVALLTRQRPIAPDANITALWNSSSFTQTVTAMLALQPRTRHVLVVNTALASNTALNDDVRRQLSRFGDLVAIDYVQDLPLEAALARVRALTPDSAVLMLRLAIDTAGVPLDPRLGFEALLRAAPVPVYVISDQAVGTGAVGGVVFDTAGTGERLAMTALRLVDGARAGDIPPTDAPETALFDWRQLKRWDLPLDALPSGSRLLNQEWTLWERYRWYIVMAATVIFAQGLLISGLLVQRARRRRAERQVRESERSLRVSTEKVRDLAGRLIAAQEVERREIAGELHDDISQRLAVLSAEVDALSNQLPDDPQLFDQAQRLTTQVVEISEELHQLSRRLHPAWLDQIGLADSLRHTCKTVAEAHHVAVNLDIAEFPGPLDSDVALCLYRITQEGLHNVVKYSRASNVSVRVTSHDRLIGLHIVDDGVGFDAGSEGSGIGLISMRERAHFLGGQFFVHSAPGQGTRLELQVPLRLKTNLAVLN